jgi:hypothetical protein
MAQAGRQPIHKGVSILKAALCLPATRIQQCSNYRRRADTHSSAKHGCGVSRLTSLSVSFSVRCRPIGLNALSMRRRMSRIGRRQPRGPGSCSRGNRRHRPPGPKLANAMTLLSPRSVVSSRKAPSCGRKSRKTCLPALVVRNGERSSYLASSTAIPRSISVHAASVVRAMALSSPASARQARSPKDSPFDLVTLRKAPARRACGVSKSRTSRSRSDRLSSMESAGTPRSVSFATAESACH